MGTILKKINVSFIVLLCLGKYSFYTRYIQNILKVKSVAFIFVNCIIELIDPTVHLHSLDT